MSIFENGLFQLSGGTSSFAGCSLQWKYCQYHTGHLLAFRKTAIKALKQGVKFVQTQQVYYNN